MKYRQLGNTDLKVSELGLGCSRLGKGFFNDPSKEDRLILEEAFEQGINFFDTAVNYSYGNSEKLLGTTFKSKRKDVIFATKGGFLESSFAKYGKILLPFRTLLAPLLKPYSKQLKASAKVRQNFDPSFLKSQFELSLTQLQTDYVDLYQLHSPNLSVLQNPGIYKWLDQEKKSGRMIHLGVSVNTIDEAVWILQNTDFETLQIPFNFVDTAAATQLFPLIDSGRKIGIISRIPFAKGKLLGNEQAHIAGFDEEAKSFINQARNEKVTLYEKALKYVLDFKEVSTVIPGTSSLSHLKENIRALGY